MMASPSIPSARCPHTGLPMRDALFALLDRGPEPFHAVLVRVEVGDLKAASGHLHEVLRGRGALFSIAPDLLVVLLPASLVDGGRRLIEALARSRGPRLRLRMATATWLGGCHPVKVLQDAWAQLNPQPAPAFARPVPVPTPMAGMAPLPVVRARREEPAPKPERVEVEDFIFVPHEELWG